MKARTMVSSFFGFPSLTNLREDRELHGRAFIPTRATSAVSPESAVRIVAVYRALSIISTSMGQLSLDVERQGARVEDTPAIVRRPCLHMTRREFIEELTLSLATTGNAYIHIIRDSAGVIDLHPLNPHECMPTLDPKTGIKTISYRGKSYDTETIRHITVMKMPGAVLGLGPIQAAQVELAGVKDVRDYAHNWFNSTGQPAGILSTDQKLTAEDAKNLRNAWNYLDPNGNPLSTTLNPSRVRVLGNGADYKPILISPHDAQWIESQQFNTTQIARLFGIPAPLLLAAVEGNSQTYSNVEQEWLAFTRFTLTAYIRAIEDALTEVTPRGQTVRFNIEALLRTDTKSRYEAHKLAIEMGLYTAEYARQIEGL